MSSIDERIVSMQFDNSQFEKGIQQSLRSLNELKRGLDLGDATDDLANLQKLGDSFSLARIANAAEDLMNRFGVVGRFVTRHIDSIITKVETGVKRIVSEFTIDPIKSGFKEYETQIGSVQTILANTQSKGSTLKDVNAALDELNTYADKTIYNFTEMTRNIGTFTAAGVDLDASVSAIKGIANLAAVSGSTSQQASTAMYQLSQALASGTVKLQDWNSVVNAGMGGQVFQDLLKKVAKQHGTDVDALIKKHGSFRETLSKTGWLTTEVLTEALTIISGLSKEEIKAMGYTEEEAEELAKLAETAEDAATKVKTFSQLYDTLKEAAQSGWTQTWEYIIGDFEEAKAFLSDLSDMLGEFIGKGAERRNSIFQEWHDLGGRADLIQGIKDIVESILYIAEKIRDVFGEVFGFLNSSDLLAVSSWVKDFGASLKSFLGIEETAADVLRKDFKSAGEGAAEGLSTAKEALTDLNKELKKGDRGDGVKALQEDLIGLGYNLTKYGADGIFGSETREALEGFQRANGLEVTGVYDAATKAMMETLKSSKKTMSPVKEAMSSVEETVLSKIPAGFGTLYQIVKGVFSVFHIFARVLGFVANAAGKVLKVFAPLGKVVLAFWAFISDGITTLDQWIEESGILEKALNAIEAVLGPVGNAIQFVADSILNFFGLNSEESGLERSIISFTAVWENLKKKIEDSEIFSKIGSVFKSIGSAIGSVWNGIGKIVSDVFATIKDFFSGKIDFIEVGKRIGDFFRSVYESAKLFIEGIDFNKILSDVKGFFSGVWNNVSTWWKGITSKIDLNKIATDVKAFFTKNLNAAKEFVKGINFADIFSSISSWWNGVVSKIDFRIIVNKVGTFFSDIWKKIISWWNSISAKLDVSSFLSRIGSFFTNIYNSVKGFLKEKFPGVFEFFGDIFSKVSPKISEFGKTIKSNFDKAVSAVKGFVSSKINLPEIGNRIKTFFGGIVETVKAFFKSKFPKAYEALKNVFSGLGQKVAPVIQSVQKVFGNFGKVISSLFSGKINIKAAGEYLARSFKTVYRSVVDWGKSLDFKKIFGDVKNFLSGIGAFFRGIFDKVKTYVQEKFPGAFDFFSNIFSKVSPKVAEFGESVTSSFSKVISAIKDFVSGKIDIKDVGNKVRTFFSGIVDSVKDFFKAKFPKAFDAIKNIFSGLGSKVAPIAKKVGEVFKKLWAVIKSLFTGKTSMKQAGVEFKNIFKEALSGIGEGFKSLDFSKIVEDAKGFFANAWTVIADVAGGLFESIFPKAVAEEGEEATAALASAGGFFDTIGSKLGDAWGGVSKWLSGAWETVKGVAAKLGKGGLIAAIAGVLGVIVLPKVLPLITSFIKSKRSLDKEGERDQSTGKPPWAVNLLIVAGSLALVAAAVYALGKLDTGSLIKGGAAVIILAGVLIGLMFVFKMLQSADTVMAKKSTSRLASIFEGIGQMLIGLAAVIASIALALFVISNINSSGFWSAVGIVVVIVSALVLFVGVLAWASKKCGGINLKLEGFSEIGEVIAKLVYMLVALNTLLRGSWGSFLALTPALVMLGLVMAALAGFMILIARTGGNKLKIKGLNEVTVAITALVGIVLFLSNMIKGWGWADIGRFAAAFLMLTAIMALLAGLMWAIGKAEVTGDTSNTLKQLTKMILAVVGVVSVLGLLPTDVYIKGLIGFGVIIVGLIFLFKSMGKLNEMDPKTTLLLLLGAVGMIAVAVGAIAILGNMKAENYIKGLIGIAAIFAGISLIFFSMSKLKGLNWKKTLVLMLGITLMIGVLTGAMAAISTMSWGQLLKGVIGLGVVIIAIKVVADSISKMKTGKHFLRNFAAMAVIVLTIIALAVVMTKLGQLDDKVFVKGALALGGIIAGIVILTKTMSKLSSGTSLLKGAAGIAGAVVIIVAILAAMLVLLGAINQWTNGGFAASLKSGGDILNTIVEAMGPLLNNMGLLVTLIAGSVISGAMGGLSTAVGGLGIGLAVDAIVLLFAGLLTLLDTINEWTGGGFAEKLASGGEILSSLGTAIGTFLGSIKGAFDAAATEAMGGAMESFGESASTFAAKVSGFSTDYPTLEADTDSAITVASKIKEFFDSIQNKTPVFGALLDYIQAAVTEKFLANMAKFATTSRWFAKQINGFSSEFETLPADTEAAVGVAEQVNEFFKGITGDSGEGGGNPLWTALSSWLSGYTTSNFLDNMVYFGQAVDEYAQSVKGFALKYKTLPMDTTAAVTNATLVNNFFKGISGDGGEGSGNPVWDALSSWLNGFTVSTFISNMRQFGIAINQYAAKVDGFAAKYPTLPMDTTHATLAASQLNIFFEQIKTPPAWETLRQWLGGESKVETFDQDMLDFADTIGKFAEKLSGIAGDYPTLSADSAMAVTAASSVNSFFNEIKTPPAWETLQTWIGGESSRDKFFDDLVQFGSVITTFGVWVKIATMLNSNLGADTSVVVGAAQQVSDLFSNLPDCPKWGTLTSWVSEYTPSQFNSDLVAFGSAITQFAAWSLIALLINPNLIADTSSLVTAAEKVSGLFSGLESIDSPDWGILGAFVKDYSPDEFITDMGNFGSMASTFSENIKDIDTDGSFEQKAGIAIGIADSMAQFFEKIPDYDIEQKTSAFDKFLHGENKTESFMSYMGEFAEEVGELDTKFGENFIGENVVAKVDSAVTVLKKMAALMTVLNSDVYNFDYNADAFWGLKQVIGELSGQLVYLDETTADINPSKIVKISRAIANLVDSVAKMGTTKIDSSNVDVAIEQIGKLANTSFEKDFEGSGATAGAAFAKGVSSADNGAATKAAKSIANKAITGLRSMYNSWKSAGIYVMAGFEIGMKERGQTTIAAAERIGQSIIQGLKNGTGESSPSRYAKEVGRFVDIGLANGLNEYSDVATVAAKSLGSDVITSTSGLLSSVSDLLASDMDFDPVIRPVVDTSAVESGAKAINGMLSGRTGMRVDAEKSLQMAQRSGATFRSASVNQNGSKPGVMNQSTDNSVNFSGSTFYIRNANDIHSLASEIANLTHQQQRALGGS